MSSDMRNPISMGSSSSVPTVYAPQALAPANQFGSESFSPNNGNGFSNEAAKESIAAYAAEVSAQFAEPLAYGDNDGQMAGFVSYLNNGPKMHAESGNGNNLASLFGI